MGLGQSVKLPLLLFLLLSSLVVTGATSGIGRAYAHEVSQDLETCGCWELLLSACGQLRIMHFIWYPQPSPRKLSLCSPA